jgi:hypothetical protein
MLETGGLKKDTEFFQPAIFIVQGTPQKSLRKDYSSSSAVMSE